MSEAPASPAADAGFDAAAVLAHWRAAGLAAAHPVRFRLLEAMCERLQTRPPAARTLLQARLRQAMAAGLPAVSALPYLAEIAYARRDYAAVREHLRALADLPTAAKTAAVVNL
ncbi:MAG: DUF2894 domain-containing protein, partial [Aquincola tertiaricarbonis]